MKTRIALLLTLCLFAASAHAFVELEGKELSDDRLAVQVRERIVGAMRVVLVDAGNDLFQGRMTMLLGPPQNRITADVLVNARGDGTIGLITGRRIDPSGTTLHTARVTDTTLEITESGPGGETSREIPLEGRAISDPTMLWFIRVFPEPGTRVNYFALDSGFTDIVAKTAEYVGPEIITINGREVRTHLIRTTTAGGQRRSAYWRTDRGETVQMQIIEGPVEMNLVQIPRQADSR